MADPVLLEGELVGRVEDEDLADEPQVGPAGIGLDGRADDWLIGDERVPGAVPAAHRLERLELLPHPLGLRVDPRASAN